MPISKRRQKEIAAIPDAAIDRSEIPELGSEFWENAKVMFPEPKKTVTIRLDRDVLEWFKEAGKGYQPRMNAVLRSYMESMSRVRGASSGSRNLGSRARSGETILLHKLLRQSELHTQALLTWRE